MKASPLTVSGLAQIGARLCALFFLTAIPSFAALSITQQIDPPEANVGDDVTVTFTVQNTSGINIHLPSIEGLQSLGTSSATNISFNNGAFSSAYSETFHLSPLHAGDFTIPAFDIHLQDGGTLRTKEMKLHVLTTGSAAPPTQQQAPTAQPTVAPAMPGFNPNGPVVYPSNNNPAQPAPANPGDPTTLDVPTESDGRPAKVFVVITPQTTDAYVGQSIPLRIEFYIRMDSAAQQDSLPTIKGSDFLMNNLSVRPREDDLNIMNEAFHRESWFTAISAPKSGDFPFQMERDTYWTKPSTQNNDPYTNFFPTRPNLAHESVASNQLTIHVHTLPTDGRPDNFSGAIGQFDVTGGAQPLTVAIGEPVTLHFTVNGEGNFDYVRCPSLPDDPAWKTYVPSSKIEYQDESHTQGMKSFEMAIIPHKNGTVPLPQAHFSYFDPAAKKYITVPVDLPPITVTGAMPASTTPTGTATDSSSAAAAPATNGLMPNRVDPGHPQSSLLPVYWQAWFWAIQGALVLTLIIGALVIFLLSRIKPDIEDTARLERQSSLDREVDAMTDAVPRKDALTFFSAARHAVQLHLGSEWRVKPESITLSEIRLRDPELAQTVEPLFIKADEIIYSGGTTSGVDLAHWAGQVGEILQPKIPADKS